MKYKQAWTQLAELPYFELVTIGNLLGLGGQTLQMYITRAVTRGELIRLKRGIYVTSEYTKSEEGKEEYGEFLSNILYTPSYLSLGYVLQKYGVLTESVFAYTAVTIKKTKKIINKTGSYLYTNVKDERFAGFELVDKGRYRIVQATKAKALYDYLYFAVKSWRDVTAASIEGLRLNLAEVGPNEWEELDRYLAQKSGDKLKKVRRLLCSQSSGKI